MTAVRIALFGRPVARSRSPQLFADLESHGGPAVDYERVEITSPERLAEAMRRLADGRWDGANVTSPYKLEACRLIDRLGATAVSAGAINVVRRGAEGRLEGCNTDGIGFMEAAAAHRCLPAAGRAMLLGSGGAARGVAAALRARGWEITVVSRRATQSGMLASWCPHLADRVVDWSDKALPAAAGRADLVVQATPLGMPGTRAEAPPLPFHALHPACSFVELIYEPWETTALAQARRHGLRGLNGWPMLVRQAAAALDIWCGGGAGRAVIERAAAIECRDPLEPGS